MTKSKHTFLLKGIDPNQIDRTYGINMGSNLDKKPIVSKQITHISDLQIENVEPEFFAFLDEFKRSHKCVITMIDHIKQKKLEKFPNIQCFWCRYMFYNDPIEPLGCPIGYVPSQLLKRLEWLEELVNQLKGSSKN